MCGSVRQRLTLPARRRWPLSSTTASAGASPSWSEATCKPAQAIANAGDDEVEFEATLSPGRDAASMSVELYTATREHRGQFARVMMTFWHYRNTISFPLPVRLVMMVVATLAREGASVAALRTAVLGCGS